MESAYIRFIDGEAQRMIEVRPGWFVNEAVWRKLRK